MTPNNQSVSAPSSVLVVRVGALGDTLMVTPVLRHLRARHPRAEIDFLCSRLAAPLLELNPCLTHLYPLQSRNMPFAISIEKRRLVRTLRKRNYDLAILLESAPRYRLILERANITRIRSFSEVPFKPARHAIINNLDVAGINETGTGDLDMDLPLSGDEEAAAEQMLVASARPRIGVHMGWGPRGRKRRQAQRLRGWSHSSFVRLLHMLLDRKDANIVLTGSSEDVADVEIVRRQMHSERVHSIAGRTQIRELAAVIKQLDLLISVDSGPCHMAAAVGTPLVVLWGPGRLEQTRPLSSTTAIRIVRHAVECAPCQSTPMQESCRRNICMEQITPEEVFDAACSLVPSLTPARR